MPFVSIIVPVFNVEQFLPQCLNSLLNQTLRDIEIICVNDMSPDNSALILEEYAIKDARIKVITHLKNQGLGAARNSGVTHATADYIGFIDSDDYVSADMFQSLYTAIKAANAELAWCGMSSVQEDGTNYKLGSSIPAGNYTIKQVLANNQLYPGILSVCNKLFVRELIMDIKQLPIVSEDQPILAEYFCKCLRVAIVDNPSYVYRNRQGTLSKPGVHGVKHWDAFFYAHNLFFSILESRFTKKDLAIQTVLRYYSALWRIKNFSLLTSPTWKEQQNVIRTHLKSGSMHLKHTNIVMYYILLVFLSDKLATKWKLKLLKLELEFSRSAWVSKYPTIGLFKDIARIIKRNLKIVIIQLLDKVELSIIRLLSTIYKTVNSKPLWLVGERIESAQENGWYFYQFLKNKTSEKYFYILDKQSNDYPKFEIPKDILEYNGLKHKILFGACSYYVNSHYNSCFPRTFAGNRYYPKCKTTKNVFLQHGITYADVSPYYGKNSSSIDLFICGAKPEYDYVLEHFGYNSQQLALTGFARFDGLHNFETKKQILFMPTWRRNLDNLSAEDFQASEYYKQILSFLNSENLATLLLNYNYELVFFPHYLLLKQLSGFKVKHPNIIIPDATSNVQELLKSAGLLITDVSSVHFDMAYMQKPIIYYCWDYNAIIQSHLARGYFNHKEMGFGDVLENESEVIIKLDYYLQNNCQMEYEYLERILDFYTIKDAANCERIYQQIIT